jgi:DNA replication protein DnaC
MLTHPLLPKLKELRLSGMLESLEERAAMAQSQQLSPVEFLALMLEDELERRHQRTQARRQKEAGFESLKLLADFDFAAVPTLDRKLVLEMATCQFILAKENWLICGPTGVGKSHLATAIGHEAIRRGLKVLSFATHRLLSELLAARADGAHQRLLAKLAAVELLIIDDFGLRPISSQGAEDLYEIISRRYERGSILLTSNRSPSEWADAFGDALLASAALDRLTHHARVTVITGDSYRQRHRRPARQPADSADRPATQTTGKPEGTKEAKSTSKSTAKQ